MKLTIFAILCVVGVVIVVMTKRRLPPPTPRPTVIPIRPGDRLADPSMDEESHTLQLRIARFGPEREPANAVVLYVKIIDPIRPLERWKKYEEPLIVALHENNLGD